MKSAIKEKQPFERLEITKEDLLEMFRYNKFKVRILEERVKTPTTTAYRCGPLIDLCRGPHVRHTGKIKAFKVTKVRRQWMLEWERSGVDERGLLSDGLLLVDNVTKRGRLGTG